MTGVVMCVNVVVSSKDDEGVVDEAKIEKQSKQAEMMMKTNDD